MHDINGKVLKVGDDIHGYMCGMCKVVRETTDEEHDPYMPGFILTVEDQNGDPRTINTHMDKVVKVRSWQALAEEALAIQDAVNLSGVVNSFTIIIREVRARLESEGKGGTTEVNRHPICTLFADKASSLSSDGSLRVQAAYAWAHEQVKGKQP